MPGKYTDSKDYMALMNAMYDISQFVVVVPVTNESSTTIAENCFQHVLMKYGLYHLVVIDDGNPCKFAFVAMCKNLDQNYGILVKRNYQILTVEYFNRFLNKVVTIAIK